MNELGKVFLASEESKDKESRVSGDASIRMGTGSYCTCLVSSLDQARLFVVAIINANDFGLRPLLGGNFFDLTFTCLHVA